MKPLADDAARRTAIVTHDRSLLVEAGAGSGKTAVMAGRIAMMLAEGTAPKSVVAVTFTELAASELLMRVRDFVSELASGHIPKELDVAVPQGLSDAHRANLATAYAQIDEITCTTIHGFCQRLIKPYPVEADLDPGAGVMDRDQADLAFLEVVDHWLREVLSTDDHLIAEMVLHEPVETVTLIHTILKNLRRRRTAGRPVSHPVPPLIGAFRNQVATFEAFIERAPATEEETATIATQFGEMADAVSFAVREDTPASLVKLLVTPAHPGLLTGTGGFLAFRKKGKWGDAAKRAGLSKADGDRLFASAEVLFTACRDAWQAMKQNVASRVLGDLIIEVQPALARFRDYKRSAALLDFDDLIFSARDLLRDHDDVRRALAARHAHVLVDEFQDTDPLQTEIFWRLCGEPAAGAATEAWWDFAIRPGALFLVGDPKQAIYRFRGADVAAYVRARAAFKAQDADSVLSISTNFRSCAPILTYVNDRFEAVLGGPGQPGFTSLDAFHGDRGAAPCVAAIDVAVADENGKASAERQRDAEAEAVADLCARLIGSELLVDRKTTEGRLCRPGDIALLAPTGSDLWRYEEALERHGVPVAAQAGKGLFRRQEVQDLIAITRVLADRRDTLALGALLRGPLVGLTEEELLDIVWALPPREDDPERLPRLDLAVDPQTIDHPLARDIMEKLQALARRSNATTPHHLLSQAFDVLRVRPILRSRHGGRAERALANVDLFLALAQPYGVRGLRAFAEAMTNAWTDEGKAAEGRPDAQEDAVALYTMHASKGLEWPIVVPVNTMTGIIATDTALTDRESDCFYCPVFGVRPSGYEQVRADETDELQRERVRLWYVAATRARELLVIPRLDVAASRSAWISLLDLALPTLPALDLSHSPLDMGVAEASEPNNQTRDVFAAEAVKVADAHRGLTWLAPSRDEGIGGPVLREEVPEIVIADDDEPTRIEVQGGRERGLILHKLFEEVMTGETAEDAVSLASRARILISDLGRPAVDDPAEGLSADELAGCVIGTMALPDIRAIRPTLVPEFPVYASTLDDHEEVVTFGIADATSFGLEGAPEVVVDWKSDVDPAPDTLDHYRAQVRSYLAATGAERGLIVFVTTGAVVEVAPRGT